MKSLTPPGLPLAFKHESPGDLPAKDREELLALIRIGVPTDDACNAVGLRPAIYRQWMSTPATDDIDPLIEAFQQEVWQAEGQGVVTLVKSVHSPMGEDPSFGGIGLPEVAARKAVSENRWKLLQKRRPAAFGTQEGGVKVGVAVNTANFSQTPGESEADSAAAVVATLEAFGMTVSTEVKKTLGVKVEEPEDEIEEAEVEEIEEEGDEACSDSAGSPEDP